MKKLLIVLGFFVIFLAEGAEVKMVVYNQNFAVCDEVREIEVPSGRTEIILEDIPVFIEPASIQISSLSFPSDFVILEQVFNSDVFNSDKVFSRNTGEKIDIISKNGEVYSGILLFYDTKNIGIETKDKILILNRDELKEIDFKKIEDLIYKPQLQLLVQNNKKGIHKILLKYTTSNINWKADYAGEYDEEKNKLDLKGFVSIDNKSGVDFKDVSLVLIAGEVKKMIERADNMMLGTQAKVMMAEAGAPSFEESPVFEYHKYTLKGKTDIKNGEIKQINFVSKKDIKIEKKYIYDGASYRYYYYDNWRNIPYNEKIQVFVEFKNEGEVLPAGKIRVYKNEKDGSLFIGENIIPHTPAGEKVKLSLGNAFDVKGERKITFHERISQQVYKDTYEIKIKNFKNEDINVEIIEHLYGTWEIVEKTNDYEKVDAFTIKFPVKVKKNSETVIKYTVVSKF